MLEPNTNTSPAGAKQADDCCAADPRIARHFDKRVTELAAAGDLPEMVDVSRMLLELLDGVAERRPTLLELGCGSGALTVALLERGAVRAYGVDLSAESLAVARDRAAQSGVADRIDLRQGDAALVELVEHDWVILDRVICCYPDVDRLLANAIPAAGSRIAFSVPHSRGWRGLVKRLIVTTENATNRFRGRPCPGFVHDVRRIEAALARAGFRRRAEATVGLWYAAVWERPTSS